MQKHLNWCFVFIRFGLLHMSVDKHWKKCVSQPSRNWRIHPTVEWPFLEPLSGNVIPILGVSQYQWETCHPPSMYPPRSSSTSWSVSFHQRFYFSLLFLSPFKINKVYILLRSPNKWFPIRHFQFWPPPDRPGLCNLDYLGCSILMSLIVFSPDGMHQTFQCGIQCLGSMHFHHSIILWILRPTWTQPYRLKKPVIG